MIRTLGFTNTNYKTRQENLAGRTYTVVPVVALVEGAIHAMNSDDYELVTASELSVDVQQWDGMPIYESHPIEDGRPVSGQLPHILEKRVGTVRSPKMDGSKLMVEAWLDNELCLQHAPKLLARAKNLEAIEISVGVFVETVPTIGVSGGKRYSRQWTNIKADHLALLKADELGACSIEMGCGVRAAQGAVMQDDFKTLRDIPAEERDKMSESDFAGPNRSFPIAEPADVEAAAHALGRAKGDRGAIKRKIVSIAYRKGEDFVAKLPDAWKRDQKNASLFGRFMSWLRIGQDADEMSSKDLNCKLAEALRAVEPYFDYVVGYFPVTDPTHVVYSVAEVVEMRNDGYGEYPIYEFDTYERAFELADDGVVTLGKARIEVQPVTKYEPVQEAVAEPDEVQRAAVGNGNNQYVHDNPTKDGKVGKLARTRAETSSTSAEHASKKADKYGGVANFNDAADKHATAMEDHQKVVKDAVRVGDKEAYEHHSAKASMHATKALEYSTKATKQRNNADGTSTGGAEGGTKDKGGDGHLSNEDYQELEGAKQEEVVVKSLAELLREAAEGK